jgi:hypothetical protein
MILTAGPISVTYDSGTLRYIRCGGVEVLRQIYVALRDSRWGTVPGRVSGESIAQGVDWFRIEFTATHRQGEIAFAWDGLIEGRQDGTIRFAMSGGAASSFLANRIGFCVLHPIDGCAGRDCTVEHTSGIRESTCFPELVSPHQPFFDVRAISHEVIPGLNAHVRLEGDVFETEDHRNWTDYSFKTYSRPLTMPFPYHLLEGDRVSQSVSLSFQGPLPPRRVAAGPVQFTICEDVEASFPEVGVRRIDLHLNAHDWDQELATAAPAGPVECAIFSDHPAEELDALLNALQESRPRISRWLLFNAEGTTTPAAVVSIFRTALSRLYPGVPLGGGSNTTFAELNRNRQAIGDLDFVSWAINPQQHAVDEQTLIENLQGQRPTVETARSFCAGRPLAISAVTLPCPALFAAGWVVGSLKHLAEAGVQSVTYRDIPGAEKVFSLIEDFAPERAIVSCSSDPLSAECLVLRNGRQIRMLLANFLGSEQEVLIPGARRQTLEPYGVASLDWVD